MALIQRRPAPGLLLHSDLGCTVHKPPGGVCWRITDPSEHEPPRQLLG